MINMDRHSSRGGKSRAPARRNICICVGGRLDVVEVIVGWPGQGDVAGRIGKGGGALDAAPHVSCRVMLSTWSKSATQVGGIKLRGTAW